MKILVTSPGTLFKTDNNRYLTRMIYGYDYYKKYLDVFENVTRIGKVKSVSNNDVENLIRVDGDRVTIYPLVSTNGPIDYLRKRNSIRRGIKEALKDCDAVSVRLPDPLSFDIIKYCEKLKIPYAVEVTTDVWTYLAPRNHSIRFRGFLRLYWHYLQKRACKKANGVVYVTKFSLQKRYPCVASLRSNNALFFNASFTDTDVSIEEYSSKPKMYVGILKKITLIHVSGNLSNEGKGYMELLNALIILRKRGYDVELHLVGGGELSDKCYNHVAQNNIEKYIVKHGRVKERSNLFHLLRQSDIFVFPSYTEGLPRVVVEAMLNGLPCIGSDIPGNRELLEEIALVPVKDSVALASKIEQFITELKLMNDQAARNLKAAREYSKEAVQSRQLEFYRQLRVIAENRISKKDDRSLTLEC